MTLYNVDLSAPTQENIDALLALEQGARCAAITFGDVLEAHWGELAPEERHDCREALEAFNRPHEMLGVKTAPSFPSEPD